MAKNSNKGFSLIEIIIAIAVLTLLLTPIVRQYTQTLQVTRIAKEQQEQNELAVYELEEFQRASMDELKTKYTDGYYEHNDQTCDVYTFVLDGGTDAANLKLERVTDKDDATKEDPIPYTVHEYVLNDVSSAALKVDNPVKLGTRQIEYTNKVYLDDLSNKLRDKVFTDASTSIEYSYKVAYNKIIIKDSSAPSGEYEFDLDSVVAAKATAEGFTLTNEGSLVKKNAQGFITAVVANKGLAEDYKIEDPNQTNLGNVHSLKKNQVAMIMGGTSSFDEQARDELFSLAMLRLKEVSPADWQQALKQSEGESVFTIPSSGSDPYLINLDEENQKRLIRVHCSQDGATHEYLVKVDVYYEYPFSIYGNSFNEPISFNVFTQRFKTEKAPEIYMEYQPFAIFRQDGNDSIVKYADNDYILIDNTVDEAKLYLYMPKWDMRNSYELQSAYLASGNKDDIIDVDTIWNTSSSEELQMTYDEAFDMAYYGYKNSTYADETRALIKRAVTTYYTEPVYYIGGDTITVHTTGEGAAQTIDGTPVRIRLASTYDTSGEIELDADGNRVNSTDYCRMFIFTNMNIENYHTHGTVNHEEFWAFDPSGFTDFAYVGKSSDTYDPSNPAATYTRYSLGGSEGVYKSIKTGAAAVTNQDVLLQPQDDTRTKDRMYTVTVTLEPVDTTTNGSNTITLTGAKGEG